MPEYGQIRNGSLPTVGVLIACRNYGKWLPFCIGSVLSQTYSGPIRILVFDDASTDETPAIIAAYEKEYKSIKGCGSISKPVGPSIARNILIKNHPECNIFAVLDADDEWLPTKIEKCVAKLMEHPSYGSVYTDYLTKDENDTLIRVFNESYSYEKLLQRCIVHSGIFFRKEVVDLVGGYDPELRTCEDYDFHLRTAEHFLIGHIPEALSIVRVHSQNSTNTVAKETWNRNYQRVFEKLMQRQQRANS